jgi:hypothetical protein
MPSITKLQAGVAALVMGMSLTAHAQLGGFSLPGAAKTSAASVDPDGFIKNALAAELLMRSSLDQMVESLATKEEVAKIDALKKQAAEKTDSKEKGVIEQEILKTEAALLNAKDFDKLATDDVKKMDAKQKKKLGAAAYNFVLAVLKDKDLLAQSTSLISGMGSNPAHMSKLGSVKDAAASLKTQSELAATLATKVPKVFSAVGVKTPPAKASETPVAVAD